MIDPSPWVATIWFILQWPPFALLAFTFVLSVVRPALIAVTIVTPLSLIAGIFALARAHTSGIVTTFDWVALYVAFLPGIATFVLFPLMILFFIGMGVVERFKR